MPITNTQRPGRIYSSAGVKSFYECDLVQFCDSEDPIALSFSPLPNELQSKELACFWGPWISVYITAVLPLEIIL